MPSVALLKYALEGVWLSVQKMWFVDASMLRLVWRVHYMPILLFNLPVVDWSLTFGSIHSMSHPFAVTPPRLISIDRTNLHYQT